VDVTNYSSENSVLLTNPTSSLTSSNSTAKGHVDEEPIGINRPSVEVSDQGKLFQQLDEKSEKLEGMLRSHMSPEQAKEVESSFEAIDAILDKEILSKKDEAKLDELSEKLDDAFSSSIAKMSVDEKEVFNKLDAELKGFEQQVEAISESEMEAYQTGGQVPSGGFNVSSGGGYSKRSSVEVSSSDIEYKKSNKNLNSLTTAQLNKLSALLLKKLSSIQLNKLNANQLNKLDILQLNQLSLMNQAKLNASQMAKLS
jgi:hypothetical protein